MPGIGPKKLFSRKAVPSEADDIATATGQSATAAAPARPAVPIARNVALVTGNQRYANHVVAQSELVTDAAAMVTNYAEISFICFCFFLNNK